MTRLLGVEAYALRHWDEEFPSLEVRHNASGQRVYDQQDLRTLRRIRTLLYDERYTIAGARSRLESEGEPAVADPGGGDRELVHAAGQLAGGAAIHLAEATATAKRIAQRLESPDGPSRRSAAEEPG